MITLANSFISYTEYDLSEKKDAAFKNRKEFPFTVEFALHGDDFPLYGFKSQRDAAAAITELERLGSNTSLSITEAIIV